MTVTLEDVSLITGLAIDRRPLCMSTNSDGWRQQMNALIGMAPTEREKTRRRRRKGKQPELLSHGFKLTLRRALRMPLIM